MCDKCGKKTKYAWLADQAVQLANNTISDMPEIIASSTEKIRDALTDAGFRQIMLPRVGFGSPGWRRVNLSPQFAKSRDPIVKKALGCEVSVWTLQENTIYCVSYDPDFGQEYETTPRMIVSRTFSDISSSALKV
jgi:hypothetical protein